MELIKDDVLNIPRSLCPMMVFSYGIGSTIATAIAIKERGLYNHFMWLIEPGVLATQDWLFKKVPVENYMVKHAMKFVYSTAWIEQDREKIISAIEVDLAKPWYKRIYDPLAIAGQLFDLEWIQIPGIDICSDKGDYIRLVDKNYDLKHPSPTNINTWSQCQESYKVYGRFRLD